MNAEFTLLVYHQLICMADSDETQAALSEEQRPEPEAIPLRFIPQRYEHQAGVSPVDNRPADTERTLYRWNHVNDGLWATWGASARRMWAENMSKRHGKSVLW